MSLKSCFTDLNIPIQDSSTNRAILLSLADGESRTALLANNVKDGFISREENMQLENI